LSASSTSLANVSSVTAFVLAMCRLLAVAAGVLSQWVLRAGAS
jgi:hypothetical protein